MLLTINYDLLVYLNSEKYVKAIHLKKNAVKIPEAEKRHCCGNRHRNLEFLGEEPNPQGFRPMAKGQRIIMLCNFSSKLIHLVSGNNPLGIW